jgi:hypothetical protein
MAALTRAQLTELIASIERERDAEIKAVHERYAAQLEWAKKGLQFLGDSYEVAKNGGAHEDPPANIRIAVEKVVSGLHGDFTLRDVVNAVGTLMNSEPKSGSVAPYLTMLRNAKDIEVVVEGGGAVASVYRKTQRAIQRGGQVEIRFGAKG